MSGRTRTAVRRLYRYRPVPPVACDDEGYPFHDEAPVQGDLHSLYMEYFAGALRLRYAGRRFVGSDMGLFYSEGDTGALLAPDLFVAPEPVAGHPLSYKLWERPLPLLVLEVLSRSTAAKDLGAKKHTCETLGIEEYWVLNAIGRRAKDPQLTAHRLCGKHYQRISANAAGHLPSRVLGLEFRIVEGAGDNGEPAGKTVRLFDPATGELLPTWKEELAKREKLQVDHEKLRVDHEKLRVDRERLRVDGEKLQVDHEKLRVDREKLRVDRERLRVDRERLRVERDQAVTERELAATARDQAATDREQAVAERDEAQAQAAAALARVKELEAKLAAGGNREGETPP